jgi:hypothetical protein
MNIKELTSTTKSSFASFQQAVNSGIKSYVHAKDVEIVAGSTVTVPATCDIAQFVNGAKFTGSGKIIIGKMSAVPFHRIFGEGLEVEFLPGAVKEKLPIWWGSVGDGVTDDTTAIQAVLSSGGVLALTDVTKSHNCESELTVDTEGTIISVGVDRLVSGLSQSLDELKMIIISGGSILGHPIAHAARNSRIDIISGSMRQSTTDRTRWEYHTNPNQPAANAHILFGVSGTYAQVQADHKSIRITFEKTGDKLNTLLVTPDEAFATDFMLTAGATIGTGYADVMVGLMCAKGGRIYYSTADSSWHYSGGTLLGQYFFIEPEFSYNSTTGELTVTHGYIPSGLVVATPGHDSNVTTVYMPVVTEIGFRYCIVKFLNMQTGAFVTGAANANMNFLIQKTCNNILTVDNSSDTENDLRLDRGNLLFFGLNTQTIT